MSQWSFRRLTGLHHLAEAINTTTGLALVYTLLLCSLTCPSQTFGVRFVAPLSDPYPDIPARGLRSDFGSNENTALSSWNVFSRFIKRGQQKHKACVGSGQLCGPWRAGCCPGAACFNPDLNLCTSAREMCACLPIPSGDNPY